MTKPENSAGSLGFQDVRSADWSDNIAPFWPEVLSSALTLEGLRGLASAGWDTVKGALVVPLMQRGYDIGAVKFVIIVGTKPSAEEAAVPEGK
jgi:tocopherol O-methyltransferase